MINAGIKVLSFDGTQTYNATTKTYNNVSIQVTYPSTQNYTNNPITIGDFITESSGNIWKVTDSVASDATANKLKLTYYLCLIHLVLTSLLVMVLGMVLFVLLLTVY